MLIIILPINAQIIEKIKLDWNNNLTFKDCFLDNTQSDLPYFKKKFELPKNFKNLKISINDEKISKLISLDQVFNSKNYLKSNVIYVKKTPFLIVDYYPYKNQSIIESFIINITYDIEKIVSKKNKSINSVLSNGIWYKIQTTNNGIHKINYQFLENIGIELSELNPKKIKLYGNGGGMLPEDNSMFRYSDLHENKIYIHGEDDNEFNEEDFILFYAEGANSSYIDSSGLFHHQTNIYENKNYYYLTVSDSNGKRIEFTDEITSYNYEVNYYTKYDYHELESKNLFNTGKQWYGEYFSNNEEYNFNFNFKNRIETEPIYINSRAVGRSSNNFILDFFISNNKILSLPIFNSSNFSTILGETQESNFFFHDQNNLQIKVSSNNNFNISSYAYLDYIEVQAKCQIVFDGSQLLITEPETVEKKRVTKFNVNSDYELFNVWDVTDPLNVNEIYISNDYDNFISNTDSLKFFIIHHKSFSNYLIPNFISVVSNQNLHAHQPSELIIITNKLILEEANILANLHRINDNISVNVVTTDQIYNEFSSGKQDVTAIRSYIKLLYDKAFSEDHLPKNVLLFGDASFDYKEINGVGNQNLVPTFESNYSLKLGPSYCSDDFFTFLDDNEGSEITMSSDGQDIGVGRIVVQNKSQASQIINKISNYISNTSFGDWRTKICFVADDIDDESWEFRLQENIDKIASSIDSQYNIYNIDKIYLDSYQQVSSSGGQRYPEAKKEIIEKINQGSLIIHYYGHGGEVGWAEERILELSDINSFENINNLPVFVTATCEFSRYDDIERVSAGERVLLNPNGGGIALFTTTRTITETDAKNLSSTFYDYSIPEKFGKKLTLGEILMFLKNDLNSSSLSSSNKLKFSLLGDPALKLPIPKNKIFINNIYNSNTGFVIDTINALSKVNIDGSIMDENNLILDNFNGFMKVKFYDKPIFLQTLNNDFEYLDPFNYQIQKNIIYSGNVSVQNGQFNFEFMVPIDISYSNGFGKFSFYAFNDYNDAIGFQDSINIFGINEDADFDNVGPKIELFMNNTAFTDGGITGRDPVLIALISDESGINTTGNGIGHDISIILNNDSENYSILNRFFTSDLDSYQSGSVEYPFYDLNEGNHNLKLKAWDVYNNSNTAEINFLVIDNPNLIIKNLFNYPNPFREFTKIHFEYNQPSEDLDVKIEIFDINGNLIKSINSKITQSAYANSDFIWNGDSNYGNFVKSGVYILRVTVNNNLNNKKTSLSNQMILIK